jgi:hypothetical protein
MNLAIRSRQEEQMDALELDAGPGVERGTCFRQAAE